MLYEDLYPCLRIVDEQDGAGIVLSCDDPHNVYIQFDNGSEEICCFVEGCEDYVGDIIEPEEEDEE